MRAQPDNHPQPVLQAASAAALRQLSCCPSCSAARAAHPPRLRFTRAVPAHPSSAIGAPTAPLRTARWTFIGHLALLSGITLLSFFDSARR